MCIRILCFQFFTCIKYYLRISSDCPNVLFNKKLNVIFLPKYNRKIFINFKKKVEFLFTYRKKLPK